jgi:hypothetical protein
MTDVMTGRGRPALSLVTARAEALRIAEERGWLSL